MNQPGRTPTVYHKRLVDGLGELFYFGRQRDTTPVRWSQSADDAHGVADVQLSLVAMNRECIFVWRRRADATQRAALRNQVLLAGLLIDEQFSAASQPWSAAEIDRSHAVDFDELECVAQDRK